MVNCAAGKLVAVTWKETAEAVRAEALSTLAMTARGRLSG